MPVEENGTLGGASATPSGSTPPVWAISDLWDILLDKSLDTMQKNDFVAVTKNDVANLWGEEEEDNDPFAKPAPAQDSTPLPVVEHATIEDLQNIMLDSPTSESPFVGQNTEATNVDEPVVENQNTEANALDIDLGDMGAQPASDVVETPAVVEEAAPQETVEPVVEADPLAIDLGDMGTQPASDVVETPAVVEEVVPQETVEPVVEDNSSINLWNLDWLTDETPAPIESVQQIVDNWIPAAQEAQIPQDNVTIPEISIDTSWLESSASTENVIIEDIVSQETAPEVAPIVVSDSPIQPVVTENTPINNWEVTPIDIPSIPTTQQDVITQSPTNPEAVALEKVAEEITQWIDLDSLMVETPNVVSPTQITDDATAKQSPTEWLKAMFSWSNGNQKKVLIWLWAFALLGLIYFGYMLMADSAPSTPTPQVTAPVAQDTWDTMDELGSDVVIDEVSTGSTDELSWDVVVDDVTTWDTMTDTWNVVDTWPIEPVAKTPAEILSSAKDLWGQVRKALIKATIMKNAQMRLSAFGLQKDVETFIQTLENSNDMTTVSDSEIKLNSLSQRLDSILQKLDGSSQ